MKLGYFTMPIHFLHRNYAETLKEDREAVILCDKLGFYDCYIGEHLTDKAENITNSMLFLATLIHATERTKLGTGTCNLSHQHPVLVAVHAAMFDHLSEGRFILGISPGVLRSDAEALDLLDEDRNKIFAEAIDVILAIWERDPPYDIDLPDNRFNVTTRTSLWEEIGVGVMHKPYQKPRPEIVGTVVAPYSKGVIAMGARNFHPMSANFLLPKWIATHWPNYVEGCGQRGHAPKADEWRIARSIFVADDDKTALDYAKDNPNSPYRYYFDQLYRKLAKAGRHVVFKRAEDEPDEMVSLDRIVDDLMICGSVNSVVDQILAFRDTVGDFGELVYAGMDWLDPALGKRSLQLMAEEVMPRVNAAIGSSDTVIPPNSSFANGNAADKKSGPEGPAL